MPVVGTVDVAVHLHRFHNIDLFCRGVYHLRLSMLLPAAQVGTSADGTSDGVQKADKANKGGNGGGVGETPVEQVDAQGIPSMCLAQCEDMNTMVGHRKVPPMQEHRLQGPAVHGHHYHTRMFIIRYRDEELELGEVVNFQIPVELNAGRRWLEAGQKLVLQMELMFSKLDTLEKDESKKKATNGAGSNSVPDDTGNGEKGESALNLHPVSVQRFHASLGGGHWGIHAYVPVTFSGVHFVRVDCMVHGVLRNIKLEPPRADLRGFVQPAALVAAVKDNGDQSASLSQPEQPIAVASDTTLPAELGRLESAEANSLNGEVMTKRRKAYPPKYTWFSLYDDQGVGRRRTSKRRNDSGSLTGDLTLLGNGDGSIGSGIHSEDSSGKNERHPWRWGWGRRRGSNGRAFPGQEGGGDEEGSDKDGPQAVELLTLKSLEGPGKRLEDIKREESRRRRKDVYSYFVMPLVRALEAQTGTTAWLRKLLKERNPQVMPASAAPLWDPPDPSCWDDITRVLWRLFAPDDMDVKVKVAQDSNASAEGSRGRRGRNRAPTQSSSRAPTNGSAATSGAGREEGLPPMARVAFPGLIARYCRGPLEVDRSGGAEWLDGDEETCKALETDVHALAVLVFVEWKGFVSALPGCGGLLSVEMSALWLAQLRQRWACQATLHTCLAMQKPPGILSVSSPANKIPCPAFDNLGLPSKLPASARGAPLFSRLEPELGSESFGTAVRLACVDASAPYKLPLQDQLMFPEGDTMLPVCLIQRYEPAKEEDLGGSGPLQGKSNGEASANAVETLGPVVATKSPPLSPVWMPNITPAFRPSSLKLSKEESSPTLNNSSGVVVRSPPSPPRLATAPASPVARFSNPKLLRAASCSPKSSRGPVITIDASTAAAAVAAAVAAISTEEASDESPVASPTAEGSSTGSGIMGHVRSQSVPSPPRRSSGANVARGARRALLGREKPFRSLSPPEPKETDGTLYLQRRRWPAFKPSRNSVHKPERREVVQEASSKDLRAGSRGRRQRRSTGFSNIWGRDFPFSSGITETDRPPRSNQSRDPAPPPVVVPFREPSTPAKAAPRKSPTPSPARPPPKPMAEERGRGGSEDGPSLGISGVDGADMRKDGLRPGSSLLDGVEQSSDLGAFFRQHDDQDYDRGGRSRRRRRGRTSPRSFSNDMDVDADEDEETGGGGEEGENGRGSGVGLHVIVLHHGYCGSSMDMRLIKNYIRILAPDALVLNAESNERDQHTSMKVMGENLAKEVHRFLLLRARGLLLPGGQGRLSFMGHSAGAIIIRAALTHKILAPALKHMHMFVSLGTPHLGTIYGASGIVRTGMWAMKRWMKSRLLEEIGLTDAPQPRDTLLCWLSKQPGLEHFRHVVLVSADKDGYVPPQSARVQMCDSSVRDATKEVPYGQVVCEMARAILCPIQERSLYRLHLWGGVKHASGGGAAMDEYIGRAAHISMMDSPSLVCLLLCTLLDLIR